MKRCAMCQQVKPAGQFSPDRWRRDGLTSYCRPCGAARARDYYDRIGRSRREMDPAFLEERRRKNRERRRWLRSMALWIYGGVCVWCGAADELDFDHVHGGGNIHRLKEDQGAMHRRIVDRGAPLEDVALQLLCRGCHRRKTAAEAWVRREMDREVVA